MSAAAPFPVSTPAIPAFYPVILHFLTLLFPLSTPFIPAKAGSHRPTTSSSRKRGQSRYPKSGMSINSAISVKTGTADPLSLYWLAWVG